MPDRANEPSCGCESLRATLLALQARDLAMREALQADGSLFEGYHPRMEAVHRENAAALRDLIAQWGWPNEQRAGVDGAEAAWLVAQHAIAEPDFMRRCRALIQHELAAGAVPVWQFAYLDDRIRVSEGKPQHYGTQCEITPHGPVLCEVEDAQWLDERRLQAGLGPMAAHLKRLGNQPRPTPVEFASRKEAERLWRMHVGWSARNGAVAVHPQAASNTLPLT